MWNISDDDGSEEDCFDANNTDISDCEFSKSMSSLIWD